MLNHNSLMDEIIPYQFHLSQNYPNPFKEKTIIKYCVASRIRVQLTIYDAEGRLIEKLVDEELNPGAYEVKFNASTDRSGKTRILADGYYYYRMVAGDYSSHKKWLCKNSSLGWLTMNSLRKSLLFIFLFTKLCFAQWGQTAPCTQTNDYWKNAPSNGTRIYSIYFAAEKEGFAVSKNYELFVSTDAGKTWNLKETNTKISIPVNDNFLWSAEIYCSAMQTKDGGINWVPYSSQMQEHFCRVYLKDPNVEYKTASEFLNTVTAKILSCIINDSIASIVNRPQQCTEYYSNEKEGWALGWYLRNLKMNKKLEGIR